MTPTKIDLVALLEQVAGQVYGGDERALLQAWLGRNTSGQVVEVDLDTVVRQHEEEPDLTPEQAKDERELATLEMRLIAEIADWIYEAGQTNVVLMQVQPPSSIAEMAAQAAAMVLMGFERGYRMGGGDGDGLPDLAN